MIGKVSQTIVCETDLPCPRIPSDPNQSYLAGHVQRIERRCAWHQNQGTRILLYGMHHANTPTVLLISGSPCIDMELYLQFYQSPALIFVFNHKPKHDHSSPIVVIKIDTF